MWINNGKQLKIEKERLMGFFDARAKKLEINRQTQAET